MTGLWIELFLAILAALIVQIVVPAIISTLSHRSEKSQNLGIFLWRTLVDAASYSVRWLHLLLGARRRKILRAIIKNASFVALINLPSILVTAVVVYLVWTRVGGIGSSEIASLVGLDLLVLFSSISYSIKRLSPHDYAGVLLDGEGKSNTLSVLSFEIRVLCKRVLRKVAVSDLVLRRIVDRYGAGLKLSNEKQDNKSAVDSAIANVRGLVAARSLRIDHWFAALVLRFEIYSIRRWFAAQRSDFDRLLQVKYLASDRLGLHHQQLCDHIVQFSPLIMEVRVEKLIRNLLELRESAVDLTFKAQESRRRFVSVAEQTVWIAAKIGSRARIQKSLLAYKGLHGFICDVGSEESTSEAIQRYADALCSIRAGARAIDRAKILYRKQKAHAGYDLHTSLVSLCEKKAKDHIGTLQELAEGTCANERFLTIRGLNQAVRAIVYGNRDEIGARFRKEVLDQFGGDSPLILALGGYSKTAREIVKKYLPVDRDLRLLVLSGEPLALESRILVDEIREVEDFRPAERIALCSFEVLPKLIHEEARVIILFGVEACDSEFRAILSKGLARPLERLVGEIRERSRLLVVAAGGQYKIKKEQWFSSKGSTPSHLYDLDVLGRGVIDLIVTEEETRGRGDEEVATIIRRASGLGRDETISGV